MVTHKLKIIQPFFDDVKNGIKKFELRENDRDFKVGDEVYLQEYDMVHHSFGGWVGYKQAERNFLNKNKKMLNDKLEDKISMKKSFVCTNRLRVTHFQ